MAKGGNGAKADRNSGRTAVAYFRTSSAANVGADKDSVQRQRDAVTAYAKAHGLEVVREFYDAAVSGADPIDQRPGFVEMLAYDFVARIGTAGLGGAPSAPEAGTGASGTVCVSP